MAVSISELEKNKDDLEWLKDKIVLLEDLLKDNKTISLSNSDLQKLINGIKIPFEGEDGVYKVYCNECFIGSGVVNNKTLKRDVIV